MTQHAAKTLFTTRDWAVRRPGRPQMKNVDRRYRVGYSALLISLMTGVIMQRNSVLAVVLALLLCAFPSLVAAVEIGDKAPDFELTSTKGGKLRLSSLAGTKNVVVQFYVLDFAPT